MKRSRIFAMALIAMLLALCAGGAMGEASDDSSVTYELYPVFENKDCREIDEQKYVADFSKGITITFKDLYAKQGELCLVECEDESRLLDAQKEWCENTDWNLGKEFQVALANHAQFEKLSDDVDTVVFHIPGEKIKGKTNYFKVQFKAFDDLNNPDRVIWSGAFYDKGHEVDGAKEIENLTLSLIQLRTADGEWMPDLDMDEAPDKVFVRMTPGLVLDGQEAPAEPMEGEEPVTMPERAIKGWQTEDGAPYVVRAARTVPAEGIMEAPRQYETELIRPGAAIDNGSVDSAPTEPVTGSITEEVIAQADGTEEPPEGTTEEIPEGKEETAEPVEVKPASIVLTADDKEPIQLLSRDRNEAGKWEWKASTGSAVELRAGDYLLTAQPEDADVAFEYALDKQDEWDEEVAAGSTSGTLSVAPDQIYNLRIKPADADEEFAFTLKRKPVVIDGIMIDNRSTDAITAEDHVQKCQLVITGSAEDGATLAWKIRLDDDHQKTGEANWIDERTWKAWIDLGDPIFEDVDGDFTFEIRYVDDGAAVDGTQTPEGSRDSRNISAHTKILKAGLTLSFDEQTETIGGPGDQTQSDQPEETSDQTQPEEKEIVFIGKPDKDRPLKIQYGYGPDEDSWNSLEWTPDSMLSAPGLGIDKVDGTEGAIRISYSAEDAYGNRIEPVSVVVRFVVPIEAKYTIGDAALSANGWINKAGMESGQSLDVNGTAEPGRKIKYCFKVNGAGEPATVDADAEGAWSASLPLGEGIADNTTITFDVNYADQDVGGISTSWTVDLVPPAAPELAIVGEEAPYQLVTGNEATLRVEAGRAADASAEAADTPAADAETAEVPAEDENVTLSSATLNGAPIEGAELLDGSYVFTPESGSYSFTATAEDAAGNASEASIEARATRQIEIACANEGAQNKEAGETLGIADFEDGLQLSIVADSSPKLKAEWTGDNELSGKPIGDVKGSLVIDKGDLSKLKSEDGKPVKIALRVFYDGLDEDKYGGSWERYVDLWPPEVRIEQVLTRSTPYVDPDKDKYFVGEPILAKVSFNEANVEVKANGEMPFARIEEYEEYARYAADMGRTPAEEDFNKEGSAWFVLDHAGAEGKMTISATATDPAGNPVEVDYAYKLNRESSTDKISHEPVKDPITQNSEVTLSGRAKALYRLVYSVGGKPGTKDITMDNAGKWTLTLDRSDLPEGFKDDDVDVVLEYPDDYYNVNNGGDDMTDTVSVPVKLTCKLEWLDQEKPVEGSDSISVVTEPGAAVKLYFVNDGEEELQGELTADKDGLATFALETPLASGTRLSITAEANGNTGRLSLEDGVEMAEEPAQSEAELQASIEQTGRNTLRVHGTGKKGLRVRLKVDGREEPQTLPVDDDGNFVSNEIRVAEGAEKVQLNLSYAGYYGDYCIDRTFDLDTEGPEIELKTGAINDFDGELKLVTEPGAKISITSADGTEVLKEAVAEEEGETVISLDPAQLADREAVRIVATDAAGVPTEKTVEVIKTPERKAVFDEPREGAILDSQGVAPLKGWIVSASDEVPEGLALVIHQGDGSREFKLAVSEDDGEMDAEFLERVGPMKAVKRWRFEPAEPVSLANFAKGELEAEVCRKYDGGEETLAKVGFTSDVDTGRRNNIILICALAAAGLVACLVAVLLLNKRIRRISDGRIDPASGMTRLTERSRQNMK